MSKKANAKKDDDIIELVGEEENFEFTSDPSGEVPVTKPGALARERRSRGPENRAVTSQDAEFFDIV